MILRIQVLLLPFILSLLSVSAQKLKKADKATLANLQAHIQYLSDTGAGEGHPAVAGEKAAGDYISILFAKDGLAPKGDNNGWRQAFEINEGREIASETFFSINDKALILNKDYFPLAFSATKEVTGSPAIALQESGNCWFLDIKDIIDGGKDNPSFVLTEAIRAKCKECAKKGATAMILYNSGRQPDNLSFNPQDRPEPLAVPVLYLTRDYKRKYLKDESASLDIRVKVGFRDKKRVGYNVLGYLDNGAAGTVIIGAHYDHAGYPLAEGASSGDKKKLAGMDKADDNASGVAAMLELARMLKASPQKGNNYLFIAFSAAMQSTPGSSWFVGHPTVDIKQVKYMIDMERLGWLDDSTHTLHIGTTTVNGNSWEEICKAAPDSKHFSIQFDSVQSADQRAFGRVNIPALSFTTTIEEGVGGQGDEPGKINYGGELAILKYIYGLTAVAK